MRRATLPFSLAVLAVISLTPWKPAQGALTSTLYAATDITEVRAYSNTSGTADWTTSTGHQFNMALAVNTDIRTFPFTDSPSYLGHNLTLGGTLNGTPTYPNTFSGVTNLYDGTTDGTNNYAVSLENPSKLWRFDADWDNPVLQFTATGSQYSGIAYDSTDGTFWFTTYGTTSPGEIEHRDAAGALIGTPFDVPGADDTPRGLALDPADGTLWTTTGGAGGYDDLIQLTKSGTVVGTFANALQGGANNWALEFQFQEAAAGTPEPSTFVLAALALFGLGFLALRRRKRAKS